MILPREQFEADLRLLRECNAAVELEDDGAPLMPETIHAIAEVIRAKRRLEEQAIFGTVRVPR
ncbi:MAG: hypothetical protein GWN84_10305 [Gammaproteobacteria bacterium]|nr:hypothetical protein [Gammaproteobacteria bacterium]NIR29680.1 hypothetical protein [Gammaproteobacteria bacterium]NIR83257.1 hypothetical protein [Gammaproteobacteria bacterium]NIU04424.1 hypothetical protein [Gammaproteobacteria bacterium]NIV51581.1 hypothetical protein [Gammaproteobacteria bacterium]